jgi:uncharacterized protein (TIGR03437 family)
MSSYRWLLPIFAVAMGLVGASAPADAQPFTCTATSAAMNARAEGVAERTADIVLNCTGGVSTTAGQPIPLQTISVQLNTNITSRTLGSGAVSEALLLVDDPYPASHQVPAGSVPAGHANAQLACLAASGANCSILSTGPGFGATSSYNGTAGHYNIFQGVQTSPNTITWTDVPIDPPGAGNRTLRITNIRGNGSLASAGTITATIAFASGASTPITLQGSPVLVGVVGPALTNNGVGSPGAYTQCVSPTGSIPLSVTENWGFSLQPQNYNQVLFAQAGGYVGPSAAGSDQNVPGFLYYTESIFRPDPSIGGATFLDPSGAVGSATQGTQIQLDISSINVNIGIAVPSYVYLTGEYSAGAPIGVAVLQGQATPATIFAPTTASRGPNVALSIANSSASAIYEIYYADPQVFETLTIPVTVSYYPGLAGPGSAAATLSLVPASSNPNASSTDPVPRFFETSTPVILYTVGACSAPPTITSISPSTGPVGSTTQVTFTGANFAYGAMINVSNPGVTVNNITVVNPTEITANFVVAANAALGATNVTVTTPSGTSAAASFTLAPGTPTVTTMVPSNLTAGSSVSVTLTGTNFAVGDTLTVNNPGVTISNVSVVSPTQMTATFTIAATATLGSATLTVTTTGGLTGSFLFSIGSGAPSITSITPPSGSVGTTLPITIVGTNFVPGATVAVSAGITVNNVSVVNATEIIANFVIASTAATGSVNVTVTTSMGTSAPAPFIINPPPPPITLSTSALTFSYIPGSAAPPSQSFAVLSTGGTAVYTVSVATSSGGSWLAVASNAGATPGTVVVSVTNLASLSPGPYQGTITVQPADSSMPAQTVTVTLQILSSQPQLSVSTTDLRLSVNAGNPAVSGAVAVQNAGGGTLNYTASAGGASWLSITCGGQGSATSSSPGLICLEANPAGLASATYFATVTVTAGSQSTTVNVTFQVSSAPASIVLSSTGLTFTAIAGEISALPASQSVAVLNTGQGAVNWTAQLSSLTTAPWLAISSAAGSSQALGASQPAMTFAVNPAGLAAGDYFAVVNVTASQTPVSNSPAAITVLLRVLPAGSAVPLTPSASGLIFATVVNGATPAAQPLSLANGGSSAVSYSFAPATSNGLTWLSAIPPTGSAPAQGSAALSVQVNPVGLAAGAYYGQLRLGYSNSTVQNIDVVFLVTGSASQAQPRASSSCSEYGLAFDQSAPTDGGTAVAGVPYALRVKSLCVPSPPSQLNLEIDFSDGTGPLYPVYDSASGDYEVSWTPASAGNVTFDAVSYAISSGASAGTAQTQPFSVNVTAADPSGPPILTGARDTASYANVDQAAAGSYISIFGSQIAAASASASTVPFTSSLGGVQASIAGTSLPLYYVSPNQVNALVPYVPNALLDGPEQLVVYRDGAAASFTVNVVAYQPGIFSTGANGQGQGAIQSTSYQLVDASNPAQPGDTILIYCGGLGPVANPPSPGAAAPSGSTTNVTPNVYIDGLPAQVTFSGLSPSSVQLYQVNAVVPQGIHSGVINVYLTITDPRSNTTLQSNTVTIN